MKIIIPLIILVITTQSLAQSSYLEANNIKVIINPNNVLFCDTVNSAAGLEFPKGSGHTTIFSSSMWLGAKDSLGQLHVAVGSWGGPNSDFQSGPVMDTINYSSEIQNWQQVWKVKQSEIQAHIDWWASPSSFPSYSTPSSILNWPAHGDTTLGQSFQLAPFIDLNSNGVYEPFSGEYPSIKCDEAIWWIFNDDKIHLGSGGNRLKAEIHAMAYECSCSDDAALNNTVFVDYDIYNRSNMEWRETYFGQFTDGDIGCSSDDHVGSDPFRSSYYFINGDNLDEDCSGNLGYQSMRAAQSITFLAGPKMDSDGLDNPIDTADSGSYNGIGFQDGITDNERPGMTNGMYLSNTPTLAYNSPNSPATYYSRMQSFWNDGTHLMHGGAGHISEPTSSGIPCKYAFSGYSDTTIHWGTNGIVTGPWSEELESFSGNDKRYIGSIGPYTHQINTKRSINLAFVSAIDSSGITNGLNALNARIDVVLERFGKDSLGCTSSITSVKEGRKPWFEYKIYPNPSTGRFTLEVTNRTPQLQFEVFDINGKRILTNRNVNRVTEINIENQPSGVYILNISDEQNSSSERLIIER